MATAEELLRNSVVQPNPEGHIVIGGDRRITIPNNLKRLGVQYDHNMETVVFDCPRYWDNRDMSKMAVYINYMRSDKYADRYPVDNLRADDDIMHFEWTISRNVTEVPGQVSFLVCVMKTDADGNEEHHWNSELSQEAYISPGMETEEHPALEYPDEVTQLLLRMSTVEQINVQANEMQQLYDAAVEAANTAEEVKNEALDLSDYIKNSYSNAIKGNASGEIIRMDDVSPIAHEVNLFIHGKNLLSLTGTPSVSPIEDYTYHSWLVNKSGKKLTLSVTDKDASVDISDIYFGFCENGRDGLSGIQWLIDRGNVKESRYVSSKLAYVSVYPATDETIERLNARFNIQLEEGSIPTSYEPWIDPETVRVNVHGKNILRLVGNTSQNGVSMKVNELGVVNISGTSTAGINIQVGKAFIKAGHKYKPTVDILSGNIILGCWNETTGSSIAPGSDGYLSSNVDAELTVFIYNADTNVTFNARFKPMIQYVCDGMTDNFESYYRYDIKPGSADGTCVVTSKSPTMTLFTDTPGVTVEAEYNVDTVKFLNAIITDARIQAATDAWLSAHYVEAEGVSF